MTYFHPRDFDFNQPKLPGLSLNRQFKSYVGLKNCRNKLQKWLTDFRFIDIREANKNDNRKRNKKVKTIKPKKVSWKEYKIMNEKSPRKKIGARFQDFPSNLNQESSYKRTRATLGLKESKVFMWQMQQRATFKQKCFGSAQCAHSSYLLH